MKKRVLEDTNKSKLSLPTWLLPLLAYLFLIMGDIIGSVVDLFVSFLIYGRSTLVFLEDESQLFQLGSFAFISLVVMLWVVLVEKRSVKSLGFYKSNRGKELMIGWAWGMGLMSVSILLLFLTGQIQLVSVDFSLSTIFYVLLILPFWFIQGGTEELLVRGWLLPLVTVKKNLAYGIGISSSLFAVLHLGNVGISPVALVNLVLFGVFAGLYFLKTDNIWGIAALHGAWNFMQGNFFGLEVSGSLVPNSLFHFASKSEGVSVLTGGAFGPEGSLFVSLVFGVGIYYLYRELKKEKSL